MAYMRTGELRERGYVPLKGNHFPQTFASAFLLTAQKHSRLTPAVVRHTADESFLTNGYLDKTIIDWIPGVPPISLGDISSFVRTTDPDDIGLRLSESEPSNCPKAGALILNTFEELDADVLAALRSEYARVFTVGPRGSLL